MNLHRSLLTAALCTLITFGNVPLLSAQVASWGSTASVGVVDDADAAHLDTIGYWIRCKSSAPTGTHLNLRYDVAMENNGIFPDTWDLRVKFRDRGSNERIIVRLKEHNVSTGVTYTRMTLDSNSYSASSGWQVRTVRQTMAGWGFDNTRSVYYVEVDLYKATSSGRPDLASLQIIGSIG